MTGNLGGVTSRRRFYSSRYYSLRNASYIRLKELESPKINKNRIETYSVVFI